MAMWSALLHPLLIAAALLYAPGGLIAIAARLPVRVVVALAPALSVAVIAGTGLLAPGLGLAWGVSVVAGATAIIVLAAIAVRAAHRLTGILISRRARAAAQDARDDGAPNDPDGAVPSEEPAPQESAGPSPAPASIGGRVSRCWAAARGPAEDLGLWIVSAALMLAICAQFINAPNAFSQTYDAVYHLNAVRWILDTGNASSLSFDMVISRGAVYPLGWHTLVALTMRLSGITNIPLASNAVMCAVAGLTWTSGVITLTSALTVGRRAGRIATAVLASAAPAFPLLGLFWGILYPVFLATAMLPGVFLTAATAGARGMTLPRRAVLWLMAGAGCVGLALAHPSIIVIALIAAVSAAATRSVSLAVCAVRARHHMRRAALAYVLTALLAGASWFAAPALRASKSVSQWPPYTSVAGGIGEAVTSAPELTAIVWPLALLTVIGFLSAWHRQGTRWVALTHTVICGLYVVDVSQKVSPLRYSLTGFWYSDAYRSGGFMMVTALPLAGIGACALADAAGRALPRPARAATTVPWLRAALTIVVIAALAWQSTGSAAMSYNLKKFGLTFLVTDDSQSLTADELAVVNRLPDLLGPDDVVLADPWRGGSLAYGLTGVTTLPRHLSSYGSTSPALTVLENSLDEVGDNPEVCPAIEELGVNYVLDFKGRTILDGPEAPGLSDIQPRDGFRTVLRIGDATLYRITACA